MRIPDILNAPWAILPDKLEQIHAIYQRRLFNENTDIAAIEAQIGKPLQNPQQNYRIITGVAIIPIAGVIARKMNLFMQISGGTSIEILLNDIGAALEDPEVEAILLDIDSPGGEIGMLETIGTFIYEARAKKPIVAFTASMMASAAYWIGSSASMIIAENQAMAGSIGVVTIHYDYSKSDEMGGVKRTYLAAGRYKTLGNDAEPLNEFARTEIQGRLDYLYTIFVDTVARNRGTDARTVIEKMADGRVFIGRQALDAGLVDAIGTYDDALLAALSMIEAETPQYLIRR